MLNIISMLKYPRLSKILLPFKIYQKSYIKVRKTASVFLKSRVVLGNRPKLGTISQLPINLYFGHNSKINIGESVSIGPGVSIVVKDNANLTIGDGCFFTSNMYIEVLHNLEIGNDVGIAWGVSIIDKNQHEVIYNENKKIKDKRVVIGSHVWIGCNVTVLPGTKIGNNTVIAANSVVKGAFPENVLIAGNPGKVVKENVTFNW